MTINYRFLNNKYFSYGGIMQRLLRLSLLALLLCILAFSESYSQGRAFLSGEIQKGHVRILVKDSLYVINRDYTVYGSLLIEPELKSNSIRTVD